MKKPKRYVDPRQMDLFEEDKRKEGEWSFFGKINLPDSFHERISQRDMERLITGPVFMPRDYYHVIPNIASSLYGMQTIEPTRWVSIPEWIGAYVSDGEQREAQTEESPSPSNEGTL
jgi:hypothetical protein